MAFCGCKGIRTCLICERQATALTTIHPITSANLHMCYKCGRVVNSTLNPAPHKPLQLCSSGCSDDRLTVQPTDIQDAIHPLFGADHHIEAKGIRDVVCDFSGVTVLKEFVSEEEERAIVAEIDRRKWAQSQSGRRKQDYGPKVNFKRQKVKLGSFNGLPSFSKVLVQRMHSTVPQLVNFEPVELCNLEYTPDRGSAIDPHCDDSWLWGERLVTLNLLSHTLLTFSTPSHPHTPATTPLTFSIPSTADQGKMRTESAAQTQTSRDPSLAPHDPLSSHKPSTSQATHGPVASQAPHDPPNSQIEIHVPLPQRSLVIVSGPARHVWHHSIKREHIVSRRLAVTLRELTLEFLDGDANFEVGKSLLDIASKFDGQPINFV